MMKALWLTLCLLAQPALAQEFTTLKGHGGPIMDIAVTPDGRVATASFDNTVGLWTDRTPHWYEGHDAAVSRVVATPEGLVSGGDDFAVIRWPDGKTLGQHAGKVQALDVLPDGRIISGSWDGTVKIWGALEQTLMSPRGSVNAVGVGPDGVIFVATTRGEILRYDTPEAAPLPLVQHGFGVNRMVAGAGWLAYGAVDGGTRVIDAKTGAAIADFTLDRRPILALAHHAGTGQIAVGDGQGYIMLIDTRNWRITRDFRATREGPVWALAFSLDGQTIWAGGLDDVAYGWPVAALDRFDPEMGQERSFLRAADTMPNGERQFMRKCSICHALTSDPSRKAGPTLHGVFGRQAGTVPGYRYSEILDGSPIIWDEATIDALFDQGPDHFIPGSKMPMQVIAGPQDRSDLIAFLKQATQKDEKP